ncbi:MAG TPA: Gfo/Idh/MocA family oxidoreductase [Lacunisphaera sp.]|nr:Gfo/Idh/MocA family oxidoreductase [Lacunisphaera sp.]
MPHRLLLGHCFLLFITIGYAAEPFRLAIVGLDHGHVDGYLAETLRRPDVKLVGVVEPKPALAASFAERFKIPAALHFSSLETMLASAKPEAVMVFTSTFDHRQVVETCAAHGVHVMMEKPLAVSMEHARAMARAARQHHIHVLVNYETTWYPSHEQAYTLVHRQGALGDLRKVVVRDGHQGPKEIGCPESFLVWLTDPVLNGGGALMDFGCYGANLITWLMDGQRPTRVTAVTQQLKPDVYPKVDDDATVILTYPRATGIIQASWNWPIGRKDMDIYGITGAIAIADRSHLQLLRPKGPPELLDPAPLAPNLREPIAYLAAVVRGEIPEHPLSGLENNLLVTEILDAARESARTGQGIDLPAKPPE